MGTIVARARANGTTAYMAKIILKRDGAIVHRETKTFDRRPAAVAWIARREDELAKPGEIERAKTSTVTLADAIDKYTTESIKEIGRTKAQVLKSIKAFSIANLPCDKIVSADIVALATELLADKQPQTVGNYLSHLSAIFAIARPAWGYPLNPQEMADALKVTKRLGSISKSRKRDRRPTLGELERIMALYEERQKQRPAMAPMTKLVAFAIFSTRRQEEITRIAWDDLDVAGRRILVRDMKNPGDKIGNDIWCDLPEPALEIIQSMPRVATEIFPYSADAISASFTRAGQFLEIDNLHFHDLRHEGVSRLFEMDFSLPRAAAVSGHRSWNSLKRYTHLHHSGDKYAGWEWIEKVTVPTPPEAHALYSAVSARSKRQRRALGR